ncbi:MAG: tetratricopeptide repeat protein [Caldilineaceae bacterium]|nr:tetratricopeptide repeat protein [Caldilineaceae bacterium]
MERIYSSFAYLLSGSEEGREGQDLPAALAGGAYLFILGVQLIAILWTQSRGPLLGILLGSYLFGLLLLSALRPRFHRPLLAGWVGLGIAGFAMLVLLNTTSLLDFAKAVPMVDRLGSAFSLEGGTSRVRVLIWQGVADMVLPHDPLIYPDGNTDSVNVLRPLVGYGPEAMWIAYNPFYPPDLAHVEARNASPDRSHNETWDSLVITGLLGFLANLTLFVSLFYFSLKWLGLLVNRRDNILFGLLLSGFTIGAVALFYSADSSFRLFGAALPTGLTLGLLVYVTLAPFVHPNYKPVPADVPRLLLIVALVCTITAHFVEIHTGIAIVATRTYFWIEVALLLVLGMRWATAESFGVSAAADSALEETSVSADEPETKSRRRRRTARNTTAARTRSSLPSVPTTVLTDLLIFLTFVYIYSTNSQGLNSAFAVLFNSVTTRQENGQTVSSPAVLFLLLFTWLICATLGMAAESLQQKRMPPPGWWLRGYGLHALIVWGGWLIYGLVQGNRLSSGAVSGDLDRQLTHVAGHFALFTWLLIGWIIAAGTVFAWPWLRDRRTPTGSRLAVSAGVGVLLAIVMLVVINSVNVALVRADIIYKQGQQFDAQGNWVSSIELYRRALAARKTEDHYMLFLGRSLLEQAKQASTEGVYQLPESAGLTDVLALTPEVVSQMNRTELLRAAEVVLQNAQSVNPLNTDHTANLARLYRTWADLATDPEQRQEMLDKSLAEYDMAVQLSPNAAHLWNEKGNAHVAREERDLAEAAFRHSLSLDQRFDQTYMLLADFFERDQAYDRIKEVLSEGLKELPENAQLYSYLGVAQARSDDLPGAIDSNLKVLELQPTNMGAMRNLSLLYRDSQQPEDAVKWAEQAIAITPPNQVNDLKQLHQLAASLYQVTGQQDQVLASYERIREIDPNDAAALRTLNSLYAQNQDWGKSVEVLRALAALEPDRFEHPLEIARILQQVGQTEDAVDFANRALSLAPEDQKEAISQLIQQWSQQG